MSGASFFKVLGLATTASETSVRSRFKILALAYHPDKTNAVNKAVATSRFVEIRQAYEYCMSHLGPEEEEEEDYEDDDDADWRGKLPAGIFDANSAWWEGIQGDEPMVILKWAEACENAHRFAAVKLDEVEQRKLNVSYLKAYENFEYWRRKHIERYDEEDRIQQDINALPERLQVHVRRSLEAKRAEQDYCYEQYQEDHDEEQYFWEQEALEDPDSIPMPTDTWRYRHNAVENSATPKQHLVNFRIQCAAVEKRNIEWKEQGIEYYPQAEMDRRTRRRKATEARLLEDVARAEKQARELKLIQDINSAKRVDRLAKATATELIDGIIPQCLEDSPEDDAVPHSLEDRVEDEGA
ncbi:hypothetical protein J4E86_000222 [Alternaria arbusti]|uniref:uncharacterized protein n=2 Tax=Alternaria sect. Infectoriae TaxID=2499258 RepID=UPI00221E8CC0|nr:uncharacterized protein J4E86_000222 [Alternaria arbusti]KAI4961196.1 hypothetical protein J4E86_000222 [Alternaria arbusti]